MSKKEVMELPKQFDNITQRVIDDLKATLQKGSKVSMAVASFSIYAFEALQKELEKIDELRFIFTSPTFNKERSKKQNTHNKKDRYEKDFWNHLPRCRLHLFASGVYSQLPRDSRWSHRCFSRDLLTRFLLASQQEKG